MGHRYRCGERFVRLKYAEKGQGLYHRQKDQDHADCSAASGALQPRQHGSIFWIDEDDALTLTEQIEVWQARQGPLWPTNVG